MRKRGRERKERKGGNQEGEREGVREDEMEGSEEEREVRKEEGGREEGGKGEGRRKGGRRGMKEREEIRLEEGRERGREGKERKEREGGKEKAGGWTNSAIIVEKSVPSKNRQLHGCRVKQFMKTTPTAVASFPGSIPAFHYVTGDLGRSLRHGYYSCWWMLIEKHMPFLSSNFPVLSPGTSVCEIVVLFALFLIG